MDFLAAELTMDQELRERRDDFMVWQEPFDPPRITTSVTLRAFDRHRDAAIVYEITMKPNGVPKVDRRVEPPTPGDRAHAALLDLNPNARIDVQGRMLPIERPPEAT